LYWNGNPGYLWGCMPCHITRSYYFHVGHVWSK
jgi:hypothetical protein